MIRRRLRSSVMWLGPTRQQPPSGGRDDQKPVDSQLINQCYYLLLTGDYSPVSIKWCTAGSHGKRSKPESQMTVRVHVYSLLKASRVICSQRSTNHTITATPGGVRGANRSDLNGSHQSSWLPVSSIPGSALLWMTPSTLTHSTWELKSIRIAYFFLHKVVG